TETLRIPTIGIGASPACDGQILVTEDILGLSGPRIPKFAKQFADIGSAISSAAGQYAAEVREGSFPGMGHCFGVKKSSCRDAGKLRPSGAGELRPGGARALRRPTCGARQCARSRRRSAQTETPPGTSMPCFAGIR